MNKPVKYTLIGLAGVVVVVIGAVAVFALTFNPNRYKDEIERLAKEQTGRTLDIKGDIKMAFWPSLGAEVSGVTFSERNSTQQFVAFESAHASVKLMPLLHGQYIVDSVQLSGLKARIVKGKDGRYNFSDLLEAEAKKPAAPAKKAEEKANPVVFDIGSLDIQRASIAYSDLAAGQEYMLEEVRIKTGRIAPDAEGKLELGMLAKRKSPPLEARVALDGRYRLQNGTLSAEVNGKLDESTLKASFTLSDPYVFDASIDKIDVDRYLGAAEQKPAAKPAAPAKPQSAKSEDAPIDFSALKGINAKGKLEIGELEVRGLKLSEVSAQLNAAKGRVAIAPHSAKGYEGTISGEVVVDANKNHLTLKEKLEGISIGPILRDFAEQDRLEGKGNLTLDVTTAGKTVNAMKRALAGTARLELRDGAVKGINLGEILRKARSTLGGSQDAAQGQTGASGKPQTDFSQLSASFTIKNGIARNEDLDARAPLFRLSGAGDINIPESSLNYLVKAAIVASAEGQGGRDRDKLAGLTIPVRLSGSFDALKYDVDFRGMAGEAAKSQVGERVKERIEERKDKIEDRIKGLLRR